MNLRATVVLLAAAASTPGCSCSDPLTVGALPADGGGMDGRGSSLLDVVPTPRPCGVPERRFSVSLDDSRTSTILRGDGDRLFVARRIGDAAAGFSLVLSELDLETEALTELSSVDVPDVHPLAMRIEGRTAEVFVVFDEGWGVVRLDREAGMGEVALHAVPAGLRLNQSVGVPGGFVSTGWTDADQFLVHTTRSDLRAVYIAEATNLAAIAWDAHSGTLRVLDAVLEPSPVLRAAQLDVTGLGAPRAWTTVFTGGEGDWVGFSVIAGLPARWVTGFFHHERLTDAPTYARTRLRLVWRNEDEVLHEWAGELGALGQIDIVGDADRQALVGSLMAEESGAPPASWAYAEIAPPGDLQGLRVLVEDTPYHPVTWTTATGGIATALASARIDVFVTCAEDAP